MADSKPTERAKAAAVEMEIHAAAGSSTLEKAVALDKFFPAYDEILDVLKKLVAQDYNVVTARGFEHSVLSNSIKALAKAEGRL